MRTFNLVKSLTRVVNIVPSLRGLGCSRFREKPTHGKRASLRLLILCLSLAVFGVNDAWGQFNVTITAQANPAKGGGVYTKESQVKPSDSDYSSPTNTDKEYCATIWSSKTFYAYYKANTGYTFVNWTENSSVYSTNWEISVKCDRDNKNRTVVANFTPITYTINFNGNGASGGSTDKQTFKYDEQKALTANGFKKEYIVTLNADGGTAEANTLTSSAPFLGWATSATGNVVYSNQQSVSNLSSTQDATINLYAKWGDYPSVTLPQATKSGKVLVGWSDGETTRLAGERYTPTGDITLTAIWMDSYPFTMSCNVNALKVEEEKASAFTFTYADNPTPHIADASIIAYDKTNNTLTGLKEGTTTIYFTQAATETIKAGTSDTYTITVSKIANTLTADATHSMKVDETWNNVYSNKNSDGTITTESTDASIAYFDVANNRILAPNSESKSFNSEEVTITISQAATYKYTAAEKTIKVTVNKWDNHISINNSQDSYQTSCFMDGYAQITLTATNTDYSGSPITATQTAGNSIAVMNNEQTQVTSNYNLGTATWSLSQPENYKYKAANATFTVNVGFAPREKCLTLEITDEVVLEGRGKNPKEYDITLGKDLTFKAKRSATGIGTLMIDIYVGNQWINIFDKNPGKVVETIIGIESEVDYDTYSVQNIDSTATKIKFYTSSLADYKKYYKDVEITRRSYLNASDFTINTQSDNTTLVYPGDKGTGSFQVGYSLANGGDLKIACDNSKFTLDKTTQSDVDCNSGSFTVNVTYTSQTAGTDYAHVVIYNNVYRKEITVTGITQKHQQTLNWKPNFDQMSLGQEVSDAASSSHGAVTYTSDNPDVIRIDNGTTLVAVAKGETKITATAAGDEEYEEKSIEKTISVTEKCVQYIVWTQSLMGLKLGDPNRILNAYASSEIEECTSNNGGRLVTYTSADESVVKVVNTNELQIVGVGTTTITAYQAGGLDSDGHDYESASRTNTVVVKDPSAKCEAFVYEQNGDAEQFFQMNTSEITGTEHTLSGEPTKITFRAKREYWNLAVNYSKGNIVLDAYTPTGGWQQVLDCGEPPIGFYQEYSKELSRDVTKIRFRRPKGGQGYHYIADAKVEMLRYIETTTPPTFQANVGEVQQQTIYLNYSNITSDILLSMASGASSHFSVDKTQITGNCGDVAKNVALTISYAPTTNTEALGEETETLIITDGTTTTNVALKGTANRVARSIVWGIDDQNTAFTVQTVNLNATAETNLQQAAGNVVYNISPSSTEGCGSINNNVLSFAKAGNVSVVATTIEDAKYLPAVAVTKSWTVNLTPTEIITDPEIDGDIVYGAQLADLKLKANTGSARNTVNQQPVEGTFAITSGDLSSAGDHTVTVTFTPTNTDMYAGCTKDINITIQKAQPNAAAHASDIIYGAAVQTSILTNEGSTEGTWSWTDEEKEKVLNVGTHEGLNVHFTPTDNTNYNEIDGTVSLTITAVTPELTWTAKPETAQVHEVKTFTASSTNTDNTAAITYSITDGSDCATIDASTGEVTMLKAGTITVQASQAATTNFNAATSITTTCTISKAPTEVTIEPQIDGEIVYGAQLSDLQLKANTGAARNTINQQAVDGTFAITSGDLSSAGDHTVTVTFTPTNTNMYASCTKDISITVQKADPNAIAQASEIIYGATVESSELTNTGATNGTWTWTDAKKTDVLPVGTHEGLKVHFTPTDQANYNEKDGTVSLTIKKAAATLSWTSEHATADVKDHLTYAATSNHSESVITYSITAGADCATINANTGELTITKAGTITVQASQDASAHYGEVTITTTTTLTGKFENIFNGNGDWNNPENWSLGLVPTEENPDVVVSGEMTISEPISVGGLTIEQNGKVNIEGNGDLTVNGTSAEREGYGNLFVRNGGNVTIGTEANVRVFDFVVESSIGTQDGTSVSGQVANGDKVLYTNGAYIDINMDPDGTMDDTQWYGFTVPFPVDVQNGVARKEGDIFRKCTYGSDYMIAEYDMNQRLNTGKGWKYIQSGQLQPGYFYYFTVNGEYNTYSFKAAENTITIHNETQLAVNGTGANANWNAVGNTTLTYATISGDNVPEYVQTYVNGQSRYQVVYTAGAQFVVGCPFFFQAKQVATVVLNKPDTETTVHYAPQHKATKDNAPMCLRIAEDGKTFTDQMYFTASEDAQDYYQIGRDLVKAGVGTKSAQIWIDAYGQQLCVHDAALIGDNAVYNIGIYAPKNGDYEIGLAQTPTDGSLYLTQDGMIIWNLSKNDYPVSLSKGTTHEYGLLFRRNQPNAPTDIESMSKEQTVDKFIYQEHLYILKNGHLYNAAGATVKQNIRK